MTGRFIRRTAMLATVAGVMIAPAVLTASASAADTPIPVAVSQACYVISGKTRPPVTVTASGLPAGTQVTITDSTGGIDATETANAAGQVAATVPEPNPALSKPGQMKDTITVNGVSATTGVVYQGTTTTYLSELAVANTGTHERPGLGAFKEDTHWSFSGFAPNKTIWGHYTYDGKTVARQSFGKAKGPCGLLSVRKRLYPATPHHKTYRLQVDSQKKYSTRTTPALHVKLALTFV